MNRKNLFLTALFAFSAATCQAGIISITCKTTAATAILYTGSKFCQSNCNPNMTKVLMRKDRDAACNFLIKKIALQCGNSAICQKFIEILQQTKTSPSQKIEDVTREKYEESIQTVKETDAYKATHKVTTETYQAAKDVVDDLFKPKK